MRLAMLVVIAGVACAQNVATRDNNVYFTDAGGQRIQLTSGNHDLFPALSPDGKFVAFVRFSSAVPEGDEIQQMCVVEAGLGEPPPVCASVRYQAGEDPLGGFSKPLWTADGRSIYFLADFSSATQGLCRFDLATGSATFVTPVNQAEGELKMIADRIAKP